MERLDFENFKYNTTEATIHLARYMNAKPYVRGKRVLDAACGEGYGSRLMHEWGAASVVGVDVSEVAVEKAKRLFETDKVNYLVHDVESLPFPDNFFDVVVSLETIEHLTNPEIFLRELRRVLKKNGTAIISCPNDNYYAQNVPNFTNIYHKRRYTWPEYRELVEKEFGEPNQWYMGNSLSGYINLPLMYCNDPDTDPKGPANMQSMLKARRSSEIEIVPQDQFVNHWVSVYYVAVWTQMEIEGCGESAAIYPVPTFILHTDKKVPEVDPYDMVKALESQKQVLHDNYKEAMDLLGSANQEKNELSAENARLKEENSRVRELERECAELSNQKKALSEKYEMLSDARQQIGFVIQERETLAAAVEQLKEKCRELEQAKKDLSNSNELLQEKNDDLEKSKKELETTLVELEKLKEEYQARENDCANLAVSISTLEKQCAEYAGYEKHLKEVEKELSNQNEYVAMLENDNRVLVNERDRLKAMNAMLSEEQTMLNSQIGHAVWQVEQYVKTHVEDEQRLREKQEEVEKAWREQSMLRKEMGEQVQKAAELQERERVLMNECDRLKGMNSMLTEENSLLGGRVDQLLYWCGTAEEKVRLIEMSEEYRFGLRCRPILKVFRKPLLFVLRIARKVKHGIKKSVCK